ncbi:hypothetical protein LUZ61_003166 [Rhynchospora tenuis]|uniref:GST N-terminal domain-containing protein n=1 Tax=Rhynchospora tenuis TaxID=198213 RepID=A0AAD6ESI1_9POAL|nr:hypothetical protein LUZ61_003166 [Rhynchospora tenuis]
MAPVGPFSFVKEVLPLPLNSTSPPPRLFDGTTRLYLAYVCPYAQRIWITRNYKGLQEDIELVAIDLRDRPAWYKEVYPENKVPSLEHNNEVKGGSVNLIKFINTHFEGPTLLPDDPEKQTFAEELLSYSDYFTKTVFASVLLKEDNISTDAGSAPSLTRSRLIRQPNGIPRSFLLTPRGSLGSLEIKETAVQIKIPQSYSALNNNI